MIRAGCCLREGGVKQLHDREKGGQDRQADLFVIGLLLKGTRLDQTRSIGRNYHARLTKT
jgi:hypothetical protein